jgi:D-serine dehydratase
VPLDGVTVAALNDQHAYLETAVPSPLQVGDLIGFGISHPCTTFDKWRALLVVEDDDTIAGLVHTWF